MTQGKYNLYVSKMCAKTNSKYLGTRTTTRLSSQPVEYVSWAQKLWFILDFIYRVSIRVLTNNPFGTLQKNLLGQVPVSPAHGTFEPPIMSAIQIRPYAIFVCQWSESCLCWSLIVPHGDIVDYRQRAYNAWKTSKLCKDTIAYKTITNAVTLKYCDRKVIMGFNGF